MRERRKANPEATRAYNKEYRARRPAQTAKTNRKTKKVTRWFSTLVVSSRCSARRYGMEHDIDANFVWATFEKQGRRCFWTGLPLEPSETCRGLLQPSLDRLDCSRGYTKDNVVVASQFANLGRCTAEAQTFRKFLNRLKEHYCSERPEPADKAA